MEIAITKEICDIPSLSKHLQTYTFNTSDNAEHIIGERKRTWCSSCTECTRNNCRECQNCLDMGASDNKKACVCQKCSELSQLPKQPLVNELQSKALTYVCRVVTTDYKDSRGRLDTHYNIRLVNTAHAYNT